MWVRSTAFSSPEILSKQTGGCSVALASMKLMRWRMEEHRKSASVVGSTVFTKESCWGSNPWSLWMGTYLERGCLQMLSLDEVISSVQFSHSVIVTPWTFSTRGFPVHHQFPELAKLMLIKSMMPSSHLILCHSLLLLPSIFPSIRVFSNESVLWIRWPKCWSFTFSISPSNEYSGLISFRRSLEWSQHYQMANIEIRLIIFIAAKDGKALYSQQKQDRELTVAQIMNSLLPISDLNWRKWGKPLNHSGMT